MTRSQIIQVVRARLDEINPLDQGTTILDPQIDAQLDSAAVSLMELLPSIMAYPATASPTLVNHVPGISIDIECPTDFLRLHRLRLGHVTDSLKQWTRSVTDLLPAGHPKVDTQQYKHVKATLHKPFGVLKRGATDIITCYPDCGGSIDDHSVAEFMYVKRPVDPITNQPKAEVLNDNLIDMLAWKAAEVIHSIHGQGNFAEMCRNNLMATIEGKLKYRS